jgi:hypothetical protein
MSNERKERILLGMPTAGEQTPGAGRGLWRASRNMDDVYVHVPEGSLPTQNFNRIWAMALTAHHKGHPFDYVALLHSDVMAEDWWLDRAIELLERYELDLLGVVVPIKDASGATSHALDRSGDTWRPLCRLTLDEVYRLPTVFTSDDVGALLLVNTGCFVARFAMEWAKKLLFTVNDRIVFNKALDSYMAEVEPEDWFFSRLCHELGLRIGATTEIACEHRGSANFTNTRPWGKPFDVDYVTASQIPAQRHDKFRFPHEVIGWLTVREGRALWELARGKRVLEVGSYFGRSTICLAQSAAHVVSIDPHDGRGTAVPLSTLDGLRENVTRYKLAERVEIIVEAFDTAQLTGRCFDVAFIDGAHDYESVRADIHRVSDVLAPSGLIVFHDYQNGTDDGVDQAVDEFLSSGAELVSKHDSLAVVRPPAAIPLEV